MSPHLRRFLILFIPFIGFLGVLPHVLFSLDVGSWHYISNAWDEDTYNIITLEHRLPVYRLLSGYIQTALQHAWGLDTSYVLMDTVIPMFSAVFASLIAYYAGFRTMSSLLIASCVLLFALAFLALSSAAPLTAPITQLLPFSNMFYPDWIRMFVPNLYENFLSLYKTPEPQVSFVVLFAALLLMLRHAQTRQWRYVAALALISLTFPFIYITTGIALVVCIACYGAMAWWVSRQSCYLWLIALAFAATLFASYWYWLQPPAEASSIFLFHSRLPIISASVLWAIIIAWPLVRTWGPSFFDASKRSSIPITTIMTLSCCLVPFITTNQQIITGTMIQSRSWDYYTNMPFVALALLMQWPDTRRRIASILPVRLQSFSLSLKRVAVILVLWLCLTQVHVYWIYSPPNLDNLAASRMLSALQATYPKAQLMLESMGDDSQVALRMGQPAFESIAGYRQTIKNFVVQFSEGPEAYNASIATIKEQAFTYFDRVGLTADALEKIMISEARIARAGPHIIYFFSLLDSWRPASDHRRHNIQGMIEKIPQLVADYQSFLASKKRRMQYGEILYVTSTKRLERKDVPWKETLVKTITIGTIRPATVYVYLQR